VIQTIVFSGFAPDVTSKINPGDGMIEAGWIDCDGFYPTLRGFRRIPSPVQIYPAPPTRVSPVDDSSVYGYYVARYLDGSTKLFAGTRTALYRGQGGTWTSVSPPATDYDTPALSRWRFAQFGNDTLGVNGKDSPVIITDAGSTFAALAGIPPVAKVVAVANPGGSGAFAFLLNLSSGIANNLLTPSMWWCSGIGDDAEWTPGADSQSANGYLNDTPGDIVGAKALGPNLIVYKEKATYVFEYLGPPVIWSTRPTSKESGALSHEAIIDIGDVHAVMGYADFYLVDGSGAPRMIENAHRRFLFEDNGTGVGDLNRNFQGAVQGRYIRDADICVWHYPSALLEVGSTPQICDRWVAWHRPSGRWTKGARDVEQCLYPEMPGALGLTYDDFGTLYATWGAPDQITYDSYVFSGSSDVVPAFGGPNHVLYTENGTPVDGAFLTLPDYGDGKNHIFVRRHRPNFPIYPVELGTKMENDIRDILGAPRVRIGKTAYLDHDSGFVFFRDNGKFHRFKYTFPAGDAEIDGLEIDFDPMGER